MTNIRWYIPVDGGFVLAFNGKRLSNHGRVYLTEAEAKAAAKDWDGESLRADRDERRYGVQ